MRIAEKGKVFVVGLTIAAVLASCPAALAASSARVAVLAPIEQTNSVDGAQVQAIRDAAAKVKVSYDEVQRAWTFVSPYEDKADKNSLCSTTPWIYIIDGVQDTFFYLDYGYYGKGEIDLDTIYVRAGDTLYSFECEEDYTGYGYDKDKKRWWATSDFDMLDDQVDWLRDMLAEKNVIVRFEDSYGHQADYTWTAEDRQAITDMINLYDLLKAASPETRAQALNS